ncbi:probable cytochrome P450 6a13 [Anabrus simplex]|uniref:probable cytochrome P450 6a13 n=1 Tax=Anabrus simplex TaxID=316456 RepID=UPI0035A3891D
MDLLLFGLVATTLLVLLAHLFLTWKFSYWHKRRVSYPKPQPLFGNIRNSTLFKMTFGEELKLLYGMYPKERYVGIFQWRSPALLVRDPELIKHIVLKDFSHFHDRGMHYDEVHDPLTAHLINLEGTRWKSLRSKLTPAFSSGRLKAMFPLIAECSLEMINHIESGGGLVDIRETLARFTTDVIGTCAFGLKFDALTDPDSQFRTMGRLCMAPSYSAALRRMARLTFPELTKALRICQFPPNVTIFFCNVIRDALNLRQDDKMKRNDFLQLLLHLKKEEAVIPDISGKNVLVMNDMVLAAQAFVFFLAGFETSSSTMSFCLYELAHHPEIQSRLREEVSAAVRQSQNGELTYEALQDLTYMDKVFSETLRKYPVAAMLLRECTREYHVPGSSLKLDPGLQIIIPTYALHHDPAYYPEPARFDPERFSEQAKAARHPFTYLPFGEGPRVCIGQRFSYLEMKVGLAYLLQNYVIETCPETVPIKLDPRVFVLQPEKTVYLKFVRRNSTESIL